MVGKLIKNLRKLSIVEGILAALIVVLLGICAYNVASGKHGNETAASSRRSKKAGTSAQATSPSQTLTPTVTPVNYYDGWQEVTFTPENIKLRVPGNIRAASNIALNTDGTATVLDLEKGFSLYVALLGNAKTDKSYGNTEKSAAYDKFTASDKQYYITNDDVALDLSTCQAQVCALPSRLDPNKSILIKIYYKSWSTGEHEEPAKIPLSDKYIDTLKRILKSIRY